MHYSDFKWAAVSRSEIIRYLSELTPMIVDKKLEVATFYKIFSTHLKKCYPIFTKKTLRVKSLPNVVSIGGVYYPTYDATNKKSILIIFQFNSNDIFISTTASQFKIICKLIADSMLHELIHLMQYRKRKFKERSDRIRPISKNLVTKYQVYLGNRDEIEAYSFNIACELLDEFTHIDIVLLVLTNENYYEHVSSTTLQNYIKHFKHTNNDEILVFLKQRVINNLFTAQAGTPIDNASLYRYNKD